MLEKNMTKNELRIGNYVSARTTRESFNIVSGIANDRSDRGWYVELEDVHFGVWLEHKGEFLLNGIPLTEEWLEKLGFNKCEFNIPDKFKKANCSFSIKYRKEDGFTVEYKHGHVYLKSVHQLQNLYFALTGNELQLLEDNKKIIKTK